jgi:hypothetical protein
MPDPKLPLKPEQYQRLKDEAAAPYRGLRKFIYVSFGVSGLLGALIFLTDLAGGQGNSQVLPNLGIQIGVVALMVWLFRLESRPR